MIWTADQTLPPRQALRALLSTDIARILQEPLAGEKAEAIADAIALYCEEHGFGRTWPASYLELLVYRTLRALGERPAAEQLAGRQLGAWRDSCFLDLDLWPGPVSPWTWQLFTTGLVRPSRWLTQQGQVMWVLDFSRLRQEDAGLLELAFFSALRAMLYNLADVWQPVEGRGVLGVRGLAETGAVLRPTRRNQHALTIAEVLAYCRDVLEKIRAERNWAQAPRLVVLDLPGDAN